MGIFTRLEAWQAGHRLALDTYAATTSLPREELFGLTSQLRRAASSIPANLAEGCGRNSDAELARFTQIAPGSANELHYHLMLVRDLGLLPAEQADRLITDTVRVRALLAGLQRAVSDRGRRRSPPLSVSR